MKRWNLKTGTGVAAVAVAGMLSCVVARGEAILQVFNQSHNEIAARLPEIAEAGYTALWVPPPTKANGGMSVGYDLNDPFDLGNSDLRGTWSTRYGVEADLHNLIELCHRFGMRVYFDNVMNHRSYDIPGYNESTPWDVYPGMCPEDFHVRTTSDGFYRKWDNVRDWNDGWQVMFLGLSDLLDIAHETDESDGNGNHFNQNYGATEGGWHIKPRFVRHAYHHEDTWRLFDRMPYPGKSNDDYSPGDGALQNYDGNNDVNLYTGFENVAWNPADPDTAALISANAGWFDEHDARNGVSAKLIEDFPNFYAEEVGDYLNRAVRWLVDRTRVDGLRLDAVKHVPYDFYGASWGDDKDRSTYGYLGQAQWQFNMTRGFFDWENHRDTVFSIDSPRNDLMAFGEHLGNPPPQDPYVNTGMRLVDDRLRNELNWRFSANEMSGFDNEYAGSELGPDHGVMHAQSHDNDYVDRKPLHHAMYFMRRGLGLVYSDGNNHAATLSGSGGAFPRWAQTDFLGQWRQHQIPTLLHAHENFARYGQYPKWSQGNFVAFQRGGEGSWATMLFQLNSGWDFWQDSLTGGDFGSHDFYLYDYASDMYMPHRHDDGWSEAPYVYGDELATGYVEIPPNSYAIWAPKNPDPSALYPSPYPDCFVNTDDRIIAPDSRVITIMEDGKIVDPVMVVRKDGVDGDPNFNPYEVADTNATDYSYTIAIPRVTGGTNVTLAVKGDGSAETLMLRLDGGMDFGNGIEGTRQDGERSGWKDLRDNPPGAAHDFDLGFEVTTNWFTRRIWSEKFAAPDSDYDWIGTSGAHTYQVTVGSAITVETNTTAYSGPSIEAPSFVWHHPLQDTEPVPVPVASASSSVFSKISAKSAVPDVRAPVPRASAGWIGATYIFANGWYKGDGQYNGEWKPGNFNGINLGIITNTLYFGGQAQTSGESDGEGNPARVCCNILSGNTIVANYTSTLYWYDYIPNNNYFESRTGNRGDWSPLAIDLSDLEDGGTYTISVWFEANGSNGNVYDNNGGANYKATFTVALDGGGGGGGDDPDPGTRATWIGKSYVNANSTWYTASGREGTDPDAWWPEAGYFNGKNLGYLRTLEVGGQAQTFKESDGENHPARMGWNLMSGSTIISNGTVSLPWLVYTNNNNYFQSGGSTFATTSIDLSGLTEGATYSLAVWFEADAADGSTYDNNNGANYVATFTYGDAPVIETRAVPQFQTDANGTTIWVKTSHEQGARTFLYYTTDGVHWPEGGGGVPANTATKAVEGGWVINTDSGSWWRFDLPAFASGTPLRYKISAFREMGYEGNRWDTIWPGNSDAIANKKVMMSLWTIPGLNFATQQYHKHLDYNSWTTGFEDGYHLVTARLFLNRNDGAPVANTFRQTFYLDTHVPNGEFVYPDPNEQDASFWESEYGMIFRTDNTVDQVWVHITDRDVSNDGPGNGFNKAGDIEWAPATQVSPWTKEMAQNTAMPKLWRFNYAHIPSEDKGDGRAQIRVRFCEISSSPTNNWSLSDPAADDLDALHVAETSRWVWVHAPAQQFYIDWPTEDGTMVEAGWSVRVKFSKSMIDGVIPEDVAGKFHVYVNTSSNGSTNRGEEISAELLNIRASDENPLDWWNTGDPATMLFTMPNVFNGIDGWRYALEVTMVDTNKNINRSAMRIITHKGPLLPTCIITKPPETDSDGAKWIITMEDSVAAREGDRELRETPIVVVTDSEATQLKLEFVSPTNYPASITATPSQRPVTDELRLLSVTNFGSTKQWNFAWQVTNAGVYRMNANVTVDNSGGAFTVATNGAFRSATVKFSQLVHSTTNNLDWDDDGIANTNETLVVTKPEGKADEYLTQAEIFAINTSGKTDPLNPDMDGDGLPDGLEIGTRDTVPGSESVDGTDWQADTNGDGWPNFVWDRDPPFYNTYVSWDPAAVPGVRDAQGGGDRFAMVQGSVTDPHNPDTDYDGIPDGIEDANRNGWTDGDGNWLTDFNNDTLKNRSWPNGKIDKSVSQSQTWIEPWEETSPCVADSDADGLSDGYGEDKNFNGHCDLALLWSEDGEPEPLDPADYPKWGIGVDNTSTATSSFLGDQKPYTSRAINYEALFRAFSVSNSGVNGTMQTNGFPRIIITETDPICDDTDHDGLPDGWEIKYGLDPLNNGIYDFRIGKFTTDNTHGPNGNPDGDTIIRDSVVVPYTNIEEMPNGTNPRSPDGGGSPGGDEDSSNSIVIGAGDPIGKVNDTIYYTEYTQWTLNDLVALDDYNQGGNSSDIYRCGDGFDSSRDMVAFYFRDGGDQANGGDDRLYFRVDFDDLKAFAEDGALNIYVAMNFGNYGNGFADLPDDVNCKTDMGWNAVVGVYDSQNGCFYVKKNDNEFDRTAGFLGACFNSELDTVAWSVDRTLLTKAGWNGIGSNLMFQVYTTRDFTDDNGGGGDKGGLNDFTDTIGDDWICSDYWNDYSYIAQNGKYSTCVSLNPSADETKHAWRSLTKNGTLKHAKLSLVAHGNQAIEPGHDIQHYIDDNNGAGYGRSVKIHNIYTNCPMTLHITPTLAMALQWAEVGNEKDWFSGPELNKAIKQGIASGAISLLGSTYSDHILPYFTDAFNTANVAMANDVLDELYGDGEPVVSRRVFWTPERVADASVLLKVKKMGYTATIIDQTPHLLEWFSLIDSQKGREKALGNDAYKLQRFWLADADQEDKEMFAFALSTAANNFRYANTDSGLPVDLRHLFLRRALTGEAALSSIFYMWEDFASKANADAYDLSLRWIANHPWIQVVTLDQALDDPVLNHSDNWSYGDLGMANGMAMQDWVNHACNGSYDNWYYGSWRHKGLAPKHFEKRIGTENEMPMAYGSTTNGILQASWNAVTNIKNADVRQLAQATIFASAFETAFHEEANGDLSRWSYGEYINPALDPERDLMGMSWCAQSRTRLAAVYSEVDAWARASAYSSVEVVAKDVDLDGEDEWIMRNNKVMALFEHEGGVMIGAWLKDGDNVWQMVGNFTAKPGSGWETLTDAVTNAHRGAVMKDVQFGTGSTVATLFNVTAASTSLTFKTTGLTKTIGLANANAKEFSIDYSASGKELKVWNGLSPDLATLMLTGQTRLTQTTEGNGVGDTVEVATRRNGKVVRASVRFNAAGSNGYLGGGTDKEEDWNTVNMRNAAQVCQVEVYGKGSLNYTLAFDSDADDNHPPVMALDPDSDEATAVVGTTNTIHVVATDEDGDALTLTAVPLPVIGTSTGDFFATNATGKGTFYWIIPAASQGGRVKDISFDVEFSATDGIETTSRVVRITVPWDANGNGIGDDWEFLQFGKVDPDLASNADSDDDGFSDYAEWVAGTDPQAPGSYIGWESQNVTNGALTLVFQSVPGATYQIEGTDSEGLVKGQWKNLASGVVSGGVTTSWTDAEYSQYSNRMYRIKVPFLAR